MNNTKAFIKAISISKDRGTKKQNVSEGTIIQNFGIEHDAHGGDPIRQISLLSIESIRTMQERGAQVKPGDFAENITTENIDLSQLKIGTRIQLGTQVILEVTQIGKTCHSACDIYDQVGYCIMPTEGIFAKVLSSGVIRVNDILKCF